jgi:pyridoxine 5-phosphate synthase
MIKLSVNVNKVATLRNARGERIPSVLEAVAAIVAAGAPGVTVHPRADARHIRPADVRDVASWLAAEAPGVEYNIEGDPRPDLLAMVHEVKPTQCTLVPVAPGEITSQAGWPPATDPGEMRRVIEALGRDGIRVSVFVDPEEAPIDWAASVGADRVELYTEPYARAFERGGEHLARSLAVYTRAAEAAHARGLAVNAGHDLDLANLVPFRDVPHVAEVSIGHALISHALFVGLDRAVRDYLDVLAGGGRPA